MEQNTDVYILYCCIGFFSALTLLIGLRKSIGPVKETFATHSCRFFAKTSGVGNCGQLANPGVPGKQLLSGDDGTYWLKIHKYYVNVNLLQPTEAQLGHYESGGEYYNIVCCGSCGVFCS